MLRFKVNDKIKFQTSELLTDFQIEMQIVVVVKNNQKKQKNFCYGHINFHEILRKHVFKKIVIDFDAGKNKQYFVLKVKQLSNECHFSEKCHLPKLFKKPSSQLALNTKKV
ncbi:hypothetical protein T4B_14426 [Trichinella pseudospiralis]|uniref:Uncharacterized protein n=1 Tax=Trichinella pseudospiralis TaxID=6337 RepID=A0A0V1JF11_TRIPS|nr:hypothetical protein T4B_14426 [Trichinella pseudospiralis]